MRVKGGAVLLLTAALVVLIIPATGDSPSTAPGSLAGRVVSDLEEQPIVGAQVVLAVPGGNIVATAESDADGRFDVSSIPEGTYSYGVSRAGYDELTGTVTVPGGAIHDMGDVVMHPNFGAPGSSAASPATSWIGSLLVAGFVLLAVLVLVARHSKRLLTITGRVSKETPVRSGLPPRTLPGRHVSGARRVAAMRRERQAIARNQLH